MTHTHTHVRLIMLCYAMQCYAVMLLQTIHTILSGDDERSVSVCVAALNVETAAGHGVMQLRDLLVPHEVKDVLSVPVSVPVSVPCCFQGCSAASRSASRCLLYTHIDISV